VAQLDNDKDREHETLLVDELGHFEGVETRRIGRAVGSEGLDKEKGEGKARNLLKKSGADVLIWGSVVSLGGKSAMRLYWTPSRDAPGATSSGKYLPTETLALPEEFWGDLKEILGLLTQSRLADISFGQPGHYIAGKLAPLISQVRALIEKKEGVWKPEILAGVQVSLAIALGQYGEQSGQNQPLFESAELSRKVLDQRTRERVPLQWAMTQMNLGNALIILGERESGTARLEEAVPAYREASKENTRARAPLQWAKSTGNQGIAIMLLAERRGDAKMAKLAVQQIEAAFTTSRDGGDAPSAAYYEARLPEARALAEKLAER
jgi:hypothetical protein